jgi:hypothetical protein
VSYDRQIDQVCPHFVVDEALFVSPLDHQTVVPLKPISNIQSVSVLYNGSYQIPSYGVQVPASTTGTVVGPFTITTGVNDTMVVSVNQGPSITITAPATNRMQAGQLIQILNQQAGTEFAFTTNGSQIGLVTAGMGTGASIYVSSTSTLAATFGIQTGREYRGRQVAPGWSLVIDPSTSVSPRPTRLIVFDEPLKGYNDFVQVSYTTQYQDCRRCGGLNYENDWRYGNTGETANVTDEALLLQETQKLMFTRRGSNPFHTWYGTYIVDTVGKKIANGSILQNQIVTDITTTFTRWQSIKQQQETVVGQYLSDEEYPYRLLQTTVTQDTSDPTLLYVSMTIQNRSTKPIQITRGLILPQPLNLLGSTAQQGLIRQSLSGFVLTG